ncbi:MAG: hypothetical protein KME13_25160 [Myxacorys californica WJT36-NPBG1]|jgi:hypothetical protein|nr:hypothetical protein [Myxacorys californica WJT36-NPBG1]
MPEETLLPLLVATNTADRLAVPRQDGFLDKLTEMATQIYQALVVLITFADRDQQGFKSDSQQVSTVCLS